MSFFFSYASLDMNDQDGRLIEFYNRLRSRVQSLTGHSGQDFASFRAIRPADEWKPELIDALQERQSIVCIFSPSYFESEYCGKEMTVFLERRRKFQNANPGSRAGSIIPVYWQPCSQEIPRTIDGLFQYAWTPQIRDRSKERDDLGVWNLQPGTAEFDEVVEQVAMQIRDLSRWTKRNDTPIPPLHGSLNMDAVSSAFQSPELPLLEFESVDSMRGPRAVTFVYPKVTEAERWPYRPQRRNHALRVASAIAQKKDLVSQQLTFDLNDEGLDKRLKQIYASNTISILLLEESALDSEPIMNLLRGYDDPQFKTFSAMALLAREDQREKVRGALPFLSGRARPFFYSIVGAPDSEDALKQFEKAVAESLDELPLRVAQQQPLEPTQPERSGPPTIAGPGA